MSPLGQNRKSLGYSTTPRLLALHNELAARDAVLRIVGAHGWGRDLLRADGIAEKVGGLDKVATLHGLLTKLPQSDGLTKMEALI